jgi:hypothetical protein
VAFPDSCYFRLHWLDYQLGGDQNAFSSPRTAEIPGV